MKPKVYIETTIPSYLEPRHPARLDFIRGANCLATQEWWENHRHRYDLFVSDPVLDEAAKGDANLAARRLARLADLPLLPLNMEVQALAESLANAAYLPAHAGVDVMHIAYATVHRMDFLLTLNLTHINNPVIVPKLAKHVARLGFRIPVICTPTEMLAILP